MTYNPNIPQPTDRPSTSQGQILINFTELNNKFSLEHNGLAVNGKHKFVTLQRSAGVIPAGTDIIVAQALTAAGNPYLQVGFPTRNYSVGLTYFTTVNIPAGTNTVNLLDFAAAGLIPQSGTVMVYDNNHLTRMNFSPFVYKGGVVNVPVSSAQLFSGSTFAKFDSAGSVLQLNVNAYPAGGTTVSLKITGTAI